MPRREFNTEIEIDAPADAVWRVLTDFADYPQWNPMIRRASGELRQGARLEVRFEPEGSRGHTFRPKLLTVEPGRELRWLGWPRFPGFFDSEHYWIMEEKPGGKTHLVHGTVIYGLLAPLGGKAFERTSSGPFEKMNRAHKERAETQDVSARRG
jgi:hypothetical protein